MATNGENKLKCPECWSDDLYQDHDRAETICNHCGLVIDHDMIDPGPEWHAYDSEQMATRARTGAPLTHLIHDQGLSTTIDWRNKDSSGRHVPSSQRARLYRMRRWQQRIRVSNARERNLTIALPELNKIAGRLDLPKNVREAAAVVYRKAVDRDLIKGRSIEGVVSACIYVACRKCLVPRTLDEIAESTMMDRKEIGRTYRFILRKLGMNLSPTTPADYIPRFCSELDLSRRVVIKAMDILNKAMDMQLTSGRGPTGVAAAAIYMASVLVGERKTQEQISEVAGVTQVTIRSRYKEMAEKLEVEITM